MEIRRPTIARIILKRQTKDDLVLRLPCFTNCGKGLHEDQWDGRIPEINPHI